MGQPMAGEVWVRRRQESFGTIIRPTVTVLFLAGGLVFYRSGSGNQTELKTHSLPLSRWAVNFTGPVPVPACNDGSARAEIAPFSNHGRSNGTVKHPVRQRWR